MIGVVLALTGITAEARGAEAVAVAADLTMVEDSTLQAMTAITKVVLVAPTKVGRTRTLKPTINTVSIKINYEQPRLR